MTCWSKQDGCQFHPLRVVVARTQCVRAESGDMRKSCVLAHEERLGNLVHELLSVPS
jgi:hypothetical protein